MTQHIHWPYQPKQSPSILPTLHSAAFGQAAAITSDLETSACMWNVFFITVSGQVNNETSYVSEENNSSHS